MSKQSQEDVENLTSTELKSKIQREGIWPQYTQRIKTLERTEKEFWNLFAQEVDSAKKRAILEDLVNKRFKISQISAKMYSNV
jgi:hypothetical protein